MDGAHGHLGPPASYVDVDWHSIARLLAEESPKPVLVLDRAGAIRLVNASLERCLGWSRYEILGNSWIEHCTPPAAREGVRAWLQDALQGAIRSYDLQAQTRAGRQLQLTVEGSPVGGGDEPSLLLTVEDARAVSEAPGAVDDVYYEISTATPDFGRLRWASTLPQASGSLCHQVLHGRNVPCSDCPARQPGAPPHTVIRYHPGQDPAFELVTACRTQDDSATLHRVRLSEEVYSQMVQARLNVLAAEAGLSEREQSVLRYLMMGRSVADIAEILCISPRTVKFHQTNLIEKLGVDSRVDLMRLIL